MLNLRQQDNQLGLYGQIKLLNGRFCLLWAGFACAQRLKLFSPDCRHNLP